MLPLLPLQTAPSAALALASAAAAAAISNTARSLLTVTKRKDIMAKWFRFGPFDIGS